MSFIWPLALLFALAVPLVLGLYLLAMRRRRRRGGLLFEPRVAALRSSPADCGGAATSRSLCCS